MKLIHTKNYLLVIDGEAEIKDGDICIDSTGVIFKHENHFPISIGQRKIIAYYPLTKEAKELDLPLLPPFEEVDIKKLAFKELFPHWDSRDTMGYTELAMIKSYVEGYKEAQSKSKQFSVEDMKKAIEMAREEGHTTFFKHTEEYIIQSLSAQQLPKEFFMEKEQIPNFERSIGNIQENYMQKLKTITNSEGREELVGTYKY